MSEENESTEVQGEVTEGFKPIDSQAELDRIIQGRLDRERKKHPSEDELRDLTSKAERADALEAEKAEAVAEATSRAEKAEAEALRFKVILDYEIPTDLHALVDGDSEDVLVEKAKALKASLDDKQPESAVNTSEAPRMPLEGKAPNSYALNSDQVEGALKSALGISN